MKNSSKILYAISIIVIIAAIIVVRVKGVNYSREYSKGKNVELYLDQGVEKSEIEELAKEIFGDNSTVTQIDRFKDAFSINVDDISDEQKTNLVKKLNEKYPIEKSENTETAESDVAEENTAEATEQTTESEEKTEITEDDIKIYDMPRVSGFDLIRSYEIPVIITVGVVFIYLTIRYRKNGHIKKSLSVIIKTGLITGLYFGIIILIRKPIVNIYTIPVGLAIATLSLFGICYINENEIEKEKNEENNK